ncbi:conserved hypothetical protein [Candidatus Propionivibrio aalborgensis]|uniref:Uncharacterized protein n=1 Tax=Candidatus Propionivibrio aalborgensis TaxID=1860101 RepID=A0A1A8Y449_9RHOO|nr:conserved hypothetical protein [Candidatus Propionivibrio aalborgensis]
MILSLSIAPERLVEIIKGFVPSLDHANDDPVVEGRGRSYLQIIAILSGIVTSYLARDFLPLEVAKVPEGMAVICLGLLASGGSVLRNGATSYTGNRRRNASR